MQRIHSQLRTTLFGLAPYVNPMFASLVAFLCDKSVLSIDFYWYSCGYLRFPDVDKEPSREKLYLEGRNIFSIVNFWTSQCMERCAMFGFPDVFVYQVWLNVLEPYTLTTIFSWYPHKPSDNNSSYNYGSSPSEQTQSVYNIYVRYHHSLGYIYI